ncbi:FtsX-like permease family protein [Maribacter algarum]|uniref:FtsX-like permease family protein n=1 Tax=Maribacter algarum (ex Zhang et al. 2020) TaxID=2578118 RepID=A0A5S3PDS9_9FLAO|nr:ABC transporter permease [Maribacter algarum]TMM52138.1 FtsX-like permease family protein [Maribacter algarum]
MLKNHLKLSLRNLWKNRLLSMLNLLGLSIGVGSVLTLMFSVYAYYIADANIEDQENIYYFKTITSGGDSYRSSPYPFMDKIVETSPQVIAGTHLHGWDNIWLERGDKELQEQTHYVDQEFFEVFSLPLKYGDSESALEKKYSIILTDRVSQKIFGDKNPVGEKLIGADSLNLTVTGVFEPISPYSSFRLGVVLPNELLKEDPNFVSQINWSNSFSPNFLKLSPDTDIAQLENHVNQLMRENYADPTIISKLQAMPYAELRMDMIPVVKIIINGCIATSFFVLLIVLVNLLNLNTSTMFRRTKDIAVRKVLGGTKQNVIAQFCLENGILVFASICISGILFLGILGPKLNDIFGAEFGKISFSFANDYPVVIGAIALGFLVTLVIGILPTLRFISVPVLTGIKGKIEDIKSNFFLKNSFIILQFTIAILFICIAIILNSQIGYMKNADVGFERENVIVGNIDLEYKNLKVASSKFEALLNDLKASPYVKSVATSESIPSDYFFNYTTHYDTETGKDVRVRRSHADAGYLETLKVPIVAGRNFDENLDNQENNPVIINRSAMKAFGWNSIEGKRLKFKNDDFEGYPIVGVMEDFHYQDLQNAVEPLVHFYREKNDLGAHRFLSVRVIEGQEKVVENMIASAFEKIDSRRNYEQAYLSTKVSGQYRLIEGMLTTVNVVALLTIFISCLGMFGLISFMAKRRIKEIGIRKVLGAGVLKIVVLLSKDYIILVGIAALIAFPMAWYLMNAWLGSFAYSISIQWWMFALSGLIAFLITSFTLGIQAVKSASVNPVKSLRTE